MKTIEINPRRRDVRKVGYQLEVATEHPERLRSRLEEFDITVRDVAPLKEQNHHRLTLSVVETQHVNAESRLDAAMGLLAEIAGAVELSRLRLSDRDVRRVRFNLDVECRFVGYDVQRHLALAAGVAVLQVRNLPGGNHACLKCNGEDLIPASIQAQNGGRACQCRICGYIGSYERRPQHRLLLKVLESPGLTAEERLAPVLAVIRSTAKHYRQLELRRVDDGHQAQGIAVDHENDLAEVG